MITIALDNIESVQYQDSLITKGHLSNIHVVFRKSGHIINYHGSGLLLARDLLTKQFPPQTEVERSLVERPVSTPFDFNIDPLTLEVSASLEKLKGLGCTELSAAAEQAEHFGYFSSGGHWFNVNGLREAIRAEINRKKAQA